MNNRIRIFYLITSSHFGGAETLLYEQVASLDQKVFEPLVCSIKPAGGIAEKIRTLGVPVISLDLDLKKSLFQPWKPLAAFRRLVGLLKEFNPHILHSSLFQADVLGALAGKTAGVPMRLATLHMVLKRKLPELILERMLAPYINCYLAVSKNMRDIFVRWFFLPGAKIQVIHNAVSTEDVVDRSKAPLPTGVSIDWSRPTFVMVGRIDPQKDLDTLLEAMKALSVKGSSAQLVLVGDGPDRARLTEKVRDLNLESAVTFAGYQFNPMPFIARSLALVLSSREEGLPLVVLEAMALSKAVIATNVGALSEAVVPSENGLLVPKGDASALADALEKTAANPMVAKKWGERGRDIVNEKFSVRVMRERLTHFYRIVSQAEI